MFCYLDYAIYVLDLEIFNIPCMILTQMAEKLTAIGKITIPILMTSLLLFSKSIVSMLFLGYLGDIELAGGSLSIGFANITGYSVIKGLAMAMEPVCSQAYGARRWAVLSQTYKRTVFLLLIAAIPISLLWLSMEAILLWLGQDQNITSVAQVYVMYSIPELLAQAHLQPLRIFLRTQSLTKPLTISAVCAMILHPFINYFLVVHLRLGVKGVALASAWNTLNINFGLFIYLILSSKALKPWNSQPEAQCSQGWQPLLALMVPSVFSVCLEWWWYEIMLLLCGLLSNPQASVAAMGILTQTTGLLYVFPYSLRLGLSTLVGQELGAELPAQAKQTTKTGLLIAIVCGLLNFGFTLAVRDVWGMLYTSEKQVLALTSVALPILGFCELGNCPQTAACGVLVGSARPKVGACINFSSFYLIGLPVAALMAFKLEKDFLGLWFGLAAAQASCVCMMVCTLVFTDWDYQAKRAKELTQVNEDNENDLEANLLT